MARKRDPHHDLTTWPMKPTEAEIAYAQEYVTIAYTTYSYMVEEGAACKTNGGDEHLLAADGGTSVH